MKLINFKAHNFKNLTDIDLDLNFKNILILGDPGSGKSSILAGISYLLTNSLPSNTTIKDWVKWGEKEFFLSLNFQHKGKSFSLEATGGNNSTKKKLIIDENEVYSNNEVNKKLNELFNIPFLKYAFIAEQGNTTALILDKPQERLNKLKSLLNIDYLNQTIENIDLDLKEIQSLIQRKKNEKEIKEKQEFILMDVPEVNESLISELKEKLENLKEQKRIYDENLIKYNKYLKEKEEYSHIKQQITAYTDNLEYLEKELSNIIIYPLDEFDLNVLLNLEQEIKNQTETIEKYKEQKFKYEENLKNIENLEKEKQNSLKEIEDISFKLEENLICPVDEKEINLLNLDILSLKYNLEEKEKFLNFESDEGTCPTCGQFFKINREELVKQKNEIINELKIKEEKKNTLNKLLENYKSKQKEYLLLKNRKSFLQENVEKKEKELLLLTSSLFIPEEPNFNLLGELKEKYQKEKEIYNNYIIRKNELAQKLIHKKS